MANNHTGHWLERKLLSLSQWSLLSSASDQPNGSSLKAVLEVLIKILQFPKGTTWRTGSIVCKSANEIQIRVLHYLIDQMTCREDVLVNIIKPFTSCSMSWTCSVIGATGETEDIMDVLVLLQAGMKLISFAGEEFPLYLPLVASKLFNVMSELGKGVWLLAAFTSQIPGYHKTFHGTSTDGLLELKLLLYLKAFLLVQLLPKRASHHD